MRKFISIELRVRKNNLWAKIGIGVKPVNSNAARVGGINDGEYRKTRIKKAPGTSQKIEYGPKNPAKLVCPHCRNTFVKLESHITKTHKNDLEKVQCPKCGEQRDEVRSQKYFCKNCRVNYFVNKDGSIKILKPT